MCCVKHLKITRFQIVSDKWRQWGPENPGPWDMFHVKQGTGMAWACFT